MKAWSWSLEPYPQARHSRQWRGVCGLGPSSGSLARVPPVELGPVENFGVLGAGTAFPPRTLTNEDVLRALPASAWSSRGRLPDDAQIRFAASALEDTIGVRERAWAHAVGQPLRHDDAITSVDLSIQAARAALRDAGMEAGELALILCATSTPHRMTSTVSAAVGAALGARAACMDTRTGCSAGLFALATAALYHAAGVGPALVIGAETFSKVIPAESRVAAVSLGDGAAALVVGRKPGARLESVFLETDGTLGRLITTDGALPPTPEEIARGGYVLSGMPEDLARTVPEKYLGAIVPTMRRAGVQPGEIDLYVPHQTNRAVIAEVASNVGIGPERTWNHVERHANVGSAGWMVAFAEARAEGRVKPGERVLVAAVGGGMSWAAGLLRC